jgi:hypothetical protein
MMSQVLTKEQEYESDLVACQLVIKQMLDVLDVIATADVRGKMSQQLKNIDFSTHPAGTDPVVKRGVEKAISLIDLRFSRQDS